MGLRLYESISRRNSEKPLLELDKERNRLISQLRSPGERPHAVIKRIFRAERVLVTTVRRGCIELMVTAFSFNLYQLCTLKRANYLDIAEAIQKTDAKRE